MMRKFSNNSILKKNFVQKKVTLLIILTIFLSSSLLIPKFNNITGIDRNYDYFSQIPSIADTDSILFEGNEISLNITDYGNLYETEQQVDVTNQEAVNLTYYLDDVHDWEVSEVETQINNIQDERDWVDNGVIGSDTELTPTSQVFQSEDSGPNYGKNLNPNNYLATFDGNDCDYMRIHFVLLEVEYYYDELYISNQDNTVLDNFAGYYTDFYTPWYNATELKISMDSDVSVELYGYSVDFFETYNGSMFILDSTSWNYFEDTINDPSRLYGGTAEIGNRSALRTVIEGIDNSPSYSYEDGDIAGFYQDFTIPRGELIDAWVSMDYNLLRGITTNDNYAYIKVNGETVYTRGFKTITNAGLGQWHSTGLINLDLWENSSSIFDEVLFGQSINLSVGIEIGNGVEYTGFDHLDIQEAYFDNIQLILKTSANSTQSGINLQFNNSILNDDNTWGVSYLNLTGNWNINPLKLTVTTDSPSLSFDLDTTLYGYHKTKSRVGQTTLEGVHYKILDNGTVLWEFYHNLYMPNDYTDFKFIVSKPNNWEILSVLDPTFLPVSYEGGNVGDKYVFLNKSSASYPGWWKFLATSPNYIQEEKIDISRNGQWGLSDFRTGNTGQIKAQINYSSEVPNNLDQTIANLTVYDPEGAIWFKDSAVPLVNGTVIFSSFNIATHNSTGGTHNFTIFWGNGTSIGGYKSNFVITHSSYMTLLRPDDAKLDNSTGGSVGDIIPLRIYLRDSENANPISNALLSFNWTSGSIIMVEIGLGIYDGILDTSDLGSLGLYTIIVSSYKIGYENSSFNLMINLGEDTGLQRLGSDSSIILNSNTTISFRYYSVVDEEGIIGATININITNPIYYSITETSPGTYSIKINTAFLDSIGTYQILFEFSAPGYESQTHIFQFKIVNPPPPGGSNPFLILIIIISIAFIAVLGSLSIRSYVILPRKRRKEADLLSRTQRFKDMKNVQAIVISHRLSGIPLYTKSYSLLEKQKKELFSGFIQAITTIGEEIAGKRITDDNNVKKTAGGIERLIELDFKYFYCLICDREQIRIVLVLQERASDRLKGIITNLATSIILNHSDILEDWDGSIESFEKVIPSIIDQYFDFFYKEGFILNNPKYIATIRKETEFSKMETRILNTIYSIAKNKSEFFLEDIILTVHEDNKDLIIDSIETLLDKKIIIPNIN